LTSGRETCAIGRLRRGVVDVERGVDLHERCKEFFAARRVTPLLDAAVPAIVLEPDEIAEQLLAPRDQAFALRGDGGLVARRTRRGEDANQRDRGGQRQRHEAGHRAVVRIAPDRELQRLAAGQLPALRSEVGLTFGLDLALARELRRREARVADLLHDYGELLRRCGKRLRDVERAALARKRVRDLRERLAGRERP